MSRLLLTELRWNMSREERDQAFKRLAADKDVVAVTDVEVVSRETLDLWLLPPEQSYKTLAKKKGRS